MQMQDLRQWARRNAGAEAPLVMSPEDTRALAEAIMKCLSIIDQFWETVSRRKLTEVEKYGTGTIDA